MKVIVGVEFTELNNGKFSSSLKVEVIDAINQEEALGKFLVKYKDGRLVGAFTAIEYKPILGVLEVDVESAAKELYSIFDRTSRLWKDEPEVVKEYYRQRARVLNLDCIINKEKRTQ